MHKAFVGSIAVVITVGLLAGRAAATVSIETMPVGNAGNAPDTRYYGIALGGVGYSYRIGKCDVTAGQYCAFLNAVAAADTYGLYDPNMDYDLNPSQLGCNIKRTGAPGDYKYSIATGWENRPVNYVSWGDAARFVNWLNNGQPTGDQDTSTTEDGSYCLHGEATFSELATVTRKPNARYVLPTEDEWYKAAYYDPNKPGGAGYWQYPTRSDTAPLNVLDPNGTNNANFHVGSAFDPAGYLIGAPYYRTGVGAFINSPSAYGTFDQGGNVWQLNETMIGSWRGLRGGSFEDDSSYLAASCRSSYHPGYEIYSVGFRIAEVPEPATLSLLVFCWPMLRRAQRR